uniref:hypothetical protein n=1 Tax=Akkermansia sp. TaxID=1872421 RepID=UPI003AB5FD87
QLDQEWDDVEVDEGGIDPNDFSHYLETDEVLRGFAMIALKRGYEMIDEKLLAIGAAVERLPDDGD